MAAACCHSVLNIKYRFDLLEPTRTRTKPHRHENRVLIYSQLHQHWPQPRAPAPLPAIPAGLRRGQRRPTTHVGERLLEPPQPLTTRAPPAGSGGGCIVSSASHAAARICRPEKTAQGAPRSARPQVSGREVNCTRRRGTGAALPWACPQGPSS